MTVSSTLPQSTVVVQFEKICIRARLFSRAERKPKEQALAAVPLRPNLSG
jgi:hypothetical protein